MPLPRLTPSRLALTLTLVPGAQYFSGRQCALWLLTQFQRPSSAGVVVTCTAFSAVARRARLRVGQAVCERAGRRPAVLVAGERPGHGLRASRDGHALQRAALDGDGDRVGG